MNKKHSNMGVVLLSEENQTTLTDFNEGSPIQVRVRVTEANEALYQKGQPVMVISDNKESEAKISSEAIVIDEKNEDGSKTLSLIVQKN